MRRPFLRAIILIAIFIAALIGFSSMTNRETVDLTAEMSKASMPIVYLTENGAVVNELHGYADEMDARSTRDTITPLADDGILPVEIATYEKTVSAISYEIRSLDTTRLIQDAEVVEISNGISTATANISVANLLTPGEEYLLILKVTTDGDPYYYYTRIIQSTNSYIDECLEFVRMFHDLTMDKKKIDSLIDYMEPVYSADNETLQYVTINNSLYQANWADLEGEEVTEPVLSITELNDSYNVIAMQYVFCTQTGSTKDYYNVVEYYRVRYGSEKMYLLNFERTVEEIFTGSGDELDGDIINLGIRSEDVDFVANSTGSVVCFVQQGDLWSYNVGTNYLTKIFSFRGEDEGIDVRENYNQHDIRIIRADESGSVDFVVYGYMNRGEHEGHVGISVCHYDCVTNTVEERLFLNSIYSYQILQQEIGQLLYISDDDHFYLTMGGQVHRVDLNTNKDSILLEDLASDDYYGSDDGQYLAWTEELDGTSETMYITDMETGMTHEVTADAGYYIKPIGFMGSDVIYGLAQQALVKDGGEFIMDALVIAAASDGGATILKSYTPATGYIVSAEVNNDCIDISCIKSIDQSYTDAVDDIIQNKDLQERELIYVTTVSDDVKERETVIQMPNPLAEDVLGIMASKEIVADKAHNVDLPDRPAEKDYYVYAKSTVTLGTNSITEAIQNADDNKGVVIGADQRYVWKRGKKSNQILGYTDPAASTTSGKAVAIMMEAMGQSVSVDALMAEGKSPYQILSENEYGYPIYNLTGCTMDQVLYFVGQGKVVYADDINGQVSLIIGYDSEYVTILDLTTMEPEVVPVEDASERFNSAGNSYIAIGEKPQN